MAIESEKHGTNASEETLTSERVRDTANDMAPPERDDLEVKLESSLYMDLDRGLVGWDGEQDPANPLNWARGRKAVLTILMGTVSMFVPMGSSMMAPAIQFTMDDLHETNRTLGSFMITIYVLGIGVGPLGTSPVPYEKMSRGSACRSQYPL